MACKKCAQLVELYERTPKEPRDYWLMTELFVELHGGDTCPSNLVASATASLDRCIGCVMTIPTTDDILVLKELIEDTELNPREDSIDDLLLIFKEARDKLEQAERTIRWALSSCGLTASHFLEPTLDVIATEFAKEHARLGEK